MTAGDEFRLTDGRVVVLRPAGPGDVPAITELYLGLSPDSAYRRFHAGKPAPRLVAELASVGSGTVCLVAAPPAGASRLVAEARYVPMTQGTAELALTVADGYQDAGMGHLLLDALVERAYADGLDRLRAVVLLDNIPMRRLLERYGWVLAAPTEDFSVAYLEISAIGGCPAGPGAARASGCWWTGGAGSTISRSQRCGPLATTSASAPGHVARPAGHARWLPPGSADSPNRQS